MKIPALIVGVVLVASVAGYFLVRTSVTDPYIAPREVPLQTSTKEAPLEPVEHRGASIGDENLVEFVCADGKTMTAVFARDILGLTLSDGRQMTLREAESEDGVRYLNNTETIEFRGVGETAFLVETGNQTYSKCAVGQQ